jgi:predicted RNA-binding protein YlxR (DUF448 family)
LRRLAAPGGILVGDAQRRVSGRGAYVCGPDCARRAIAEGRLRRALRRKVTVPPDFVESEFRG